MIQFNLLPQVKLDYIKATKTKRLVISVSFIASVVALAVLVLLVLSVDVVQKARLSSLKATISSDTAQLQNSPQISKVLTIQNQLGALTTLHQEKPAATRLFGYLSQVTPAQVTISNIAVDFGMHTVSVSGNANSLDSINTFADTLKFTTYKIGTSSTSTNAFSQVVLTSFSVAGSSNATTSYTISFNFDPNIFLNTDNITLTVPQTVTTRSVMDQPTDLFVKNDNSISK